ncbi:DUF3574 domain-containing protein [Bartonella harrusi]|uniref:DUF3574 domain-containing protein n=1 Tax=Bartonella harrusi TaxID=2961895 RepID=A0ABY5EUN5_9HYPH|nr:DUF3574 domain-containing protein [Bartonella harrusi]UTO27680.1 DUF3574 domain-containing protein [Bartonella harrusi]
MLTTFSLKRLYMIIYHLATKLFYSEINHKIASLRYAFLMRGCPPLKLSGTLTKIMTPDPRFMRGLTILGSYGQGNPYRAPTGVLDKEP